MRPDLVAALNIAWNIAGAEIVSECLDLLSDRKLRREIRKEIRKAAPESVKSQDLDKLLKHREFLSFSVDPGGFEASASLEADVSRCLGSTGETVTDLANAVVSAFSTVALRKSPPLVRLVEARVSANQRTLAKIEGQGTQLLDRLSDLVDLFSRLQGLDSYLGTRTVDGFGGSSTLEAQTLSVAELLNPAQSSVPFQGRQSDLAKLQEWAEQASQFSVLVLTGPAGSGKTRLAYELLARQRERQWITTELVSSVAAPAGLAPPEGLNQGLLVFIDDANSKLDETARLMTSLKKLGSSAKLRILMTARDVEDVPGRGSWIDVLRVMNGQQTGAVSSWSQHNLGPACQTEGERLTLFRSAATIAQQLIPGHVAPRTTSEWDFAGDVFDTALWVIAAAIAATDPFPRGADLLRSQPNQVDLQNYLANKERIYWQQSAPTELQSSHATGLRERMVGFATWTCAGDRSEATGILELIQARSVDLTTAAEWLASLYSGPLYWNPIPIDAVAEACLETLLDTEPAALDLLLANLTSEEMARPLQQMGTLTAETVSKAVNRVSDETLKLEQQTFHKLNLHPPLVHLERRLLEAQNEIDGLPDFRSIRLASIYRSLGEPDKAKDRISSFVRDWKDTETETLDAVQALSFGDGLAEYGMQLGQAGRVDDAAEYLTVAVDLLTRVASQFEEPSVFSHGNLSVALSGLSSAAYYRRDYAAAAFHKTSAVDILRTLVTAGELGETELIRELADLAVVRDAAEDSELASIALSEALDLTGKLDQNMRHNRRLTAALEVQASLSDQERRRNASELARLADAIIADSGEVPPNSMEASAALNCVEIIRTTEAVFLTEERLAFVEQTAAHHPDAIVQRQAVDLLNRIHATTRNLDVGAAKLAVQEAMQGVSDGRVNSETTLLSALDSLAKAYEQAGDSAEATSTHLRIARVASAVGDIEATVDAVADVSDQYWAPFIGTAPAELLSLLHSVARQPIALAAPRLEQVLRSVFFLSLPTNVHLGLQILDKVGLDSGAAEGEATFLQAMKAVVVAELHRLQGRDSEAASRLSDSPIWALDYHQDPTAPIERVRWMTEVMRNQLDALYRTREESLRLLESGTNLLSATETGMDCFTLRFTFRVLGAVAAIRAIDPAAADTLTRAKEAFVAEIDRFTGVQR